MERLVPMNYPSLRKFAVALGAATLVSFGALNAQDEAAAPDSTKLLKDFGWFMSQQIGQLELSADEKAAFVSGIQAGLDGEAGPADDKAAMMQVQQYLQGRMMDIMAKKTEAFYTELEANPNVKKSDSGLYYEIIEEGDATKAGPEDTVKLNYEGSLPDGTVFDSSLKRGQPATFPVAGVVPGFGEGVQLVGAGGKVKLYIPPQLGYGERPPPGSGIPPNSILVFDVDLIEVNPAAE